MQVYISTYIHKNICLKAIPQITTSLQSSESLVIWSSRRIKLDVIVYILEIGDMDYHNKKDNAAKCENRALYAMLEELYPVQCA
jgi:hypothetical protein